MGILGALALRHGLSAHVAVAASQQSRSFRCSAPQALHNAPWGSSLGSRNAGLYGPVVYAAASMFRHSPVSPVATCAVARQTHGDEVETSTDGMPESNGFATSGLGDGLVRALDMVGFKEPTEIQAKSIPAIMTQKDTLLASHTGSGKTLAYLLPLIQLLKDEEAQAGQQLTRPRRPRVLVLGPTRELTDQVLSVAKSLSHAGKFSSAVINGGIPLSKGKAALSAPVDILVATPQRILQHHKEGHLFFGDVRYVVLDEADTMFDQGFGSEVRQVLKPVRSKENKANVVLVTATLTKDVRKLLDGEFPDMQKVHTSSLHRATATARHDFHTVPPGRDKLGYLYELIQPAVRKGKKMIVFCNSMNSARAVGHFLTERSVLNVCYHGDVPLAEREGSMKSFLHGDEVGQQPVLVCTDLAARGLDFQAGVDQVMNFDFPKTVVDYIHRTGRTARAGKIGFVSSIIDPRSSTLAKRVQYAVERGLPLDEITSDAQRLPPSQRMSEKTRERKYVEKKESSKRGTRGAARMEKAPPVKSTKGGGRGGAKRAGRGASAAGRGGRGRGGAGTGESFSPRRGGGKGGRGRGAGPSAGGRGRASAGGGRGRGRY